MGSSSWESRHSEYSAPQDSELSKLINSALPEVNKRAHEIFAGTVIRPGNVIKNMSGEGQVHDLAENTPRMSDGARVVPPPSQRTERTVEVPVKLIGILVGRNQEAIQSLRELSKSSIQIGVPVIGSFMQAIYLRGNCDLAEKLIWEKLRDRAPQYFQENPTAKAGSTCTIPVSATDKGAVKKVGGGSERTYWQCPRCSNMNYSHRPVCNRCFGPQPGSAQGVIAQGVTL